MDTSGAGMTVYFTQEELEELDIEKLRNVASYLEIVYERKTSKAKLVLLISEFQKTMQEPFGSQSQEPPRYSVRVKRIMDSMKGNSQ